MISLIRKRYLLWVLIVLCFLAITGCEEGENGEVRGEYYNKYKIDVNCGEKFKGIVYEQGYSGTGIYFIFYKLPDGKEVVLPDEGCVKIFLEEYEYKKTGAKND